MAATLTANDAFNQAKTYMRGMPLEDVQYRVLDAALKMVWMADAWRWTIGSLTNFNLSDSTQDYAYGGGLPADYLYTWRAYLTNGNTTQGLHVDPSLPTLVVQSGGWPTHICRVPGAATFRFFPKPGILGGETVTVIQSYKKTAPLITAGNAGSAGVLVMDDEWFPVYFECVLYQAMKYGFDNRAGTAQINEQSGEMVYNGQLGVAMAAIDNMRKREPLPVEWNVRLPVEPRRK